ncbi:type I restriction enzyme HsdR N-terminal domain-containing protein [Negadavirga shengliensis]|uniref:Type I restriction enzyme HsdR N-terminal domain-containing protein n=1 Tax=Negadavirga shengliensis TaxID=1389218 RepID=A0ABV9T4R3_9BACT
MGADSLAYLELELNLPSFDFKIHKEGGKLFIFDVLRKKFLSLTPEEWVRQHITRYLIEYLDYPKSLIVQERGLRYNELLKRFDVLVMDRHTRPFLLIECKAPAIRLTQKTVEQVCLYNAKIGARYLGVTNGVQHICMRREEKEGRYVQTRNFPDYILG